MKAIKINCINRTIKMVNIYGYRGICEALNDDCVNFVCPIIFETQDTMYSDYIAIIKKSEPGFLLDGWLHPIVGNAIIVGTDLNGNLSDVILTIEEIENQISFVSKYFIDKWVYNGLNSTTSAFSKN